MDSSASVQVNVDQSTVPLINEIDGKVDDVKEVVVEIKASATTEESSSVPIPAWNPNDYMVMVKPEYLLPPPVAVAQEDTRGSGGGQQQQKGIKSNKRPRDARPSGMEKLCGMTRKGEVCNYGESCRFR